jgi:hypothetical protein
MASAEREAINCAKREKILKFAIDTTSDDLFNLQLILYHDFCVIKLLSFMAGPPQNSGPRRGIPSSLLTQSGPGYCILHIPVERIKLSSSYYFIEIFKVLKHEISLGQK